MNEDSDNEPHVPRLSTEVHRSDLCEGCKRYGDCSGFFIEPFLVFAIAKLLMSDADDSDDESLGWVEQDGALELSGFRGERVRLLPHIYEEVAHIAPEEAARLTSQQRQSYMHQRGLQSDASSSRSPYPSSGSRTLRSSEDEAFRRQVRPFA